MCVYTCVYTCVFVYVRIISFEVMCTLLLTETSNEGERIFNSVLACKRRADTTRNALNVLQRYRFLFNLPKSIEMNIKNVRLP